MPGLSDYQIPSYLDQLAGSKGISELTLDKLKELRDQGMATVESSPAWAEIPRAYDILSFDTTPTKVSGYSTVSINRIKRNFRDLVATISNLKPTGMAVTHKEEAKNSIWRLNQMKQIWWRKTAQDRRYREACQYASGLGTGYLEPWWDPNFYGLGRGEISCKVGGPASVLPVMMTEDNDIQKAYAVTIPEQVPLHIVLANYPKFAGSIESSRSFPGWMRRMWDRASRSTGGQSNGVMGALATPQRSVGREQPMVDVYTTYIMDPSVNNTGRPIPMGDPGTSWEYIVPYLGQEIPTGMRDRQGRMIMKRADMEDARLFPLRRRAIWTDTVILKDGTSPYLHGRVPRVQLRFDDYPWDFLGTSIIHDTWRIQKAENQMWRAIVDSVLVRLQPPLKHDPNVLDATAMARINTRIPSQTLACPLGMGDPVTPLLPVAFWDVPQWIIQVLGLLKNEIDELSVVKDLMAVAKAKQIPSADSIEKIMEQAGPVVQDIARGGEIACQQFDELFYPMAIQFWPAGKVFAELGEEGAIKEMFDFSPGELIPSHLPHESQSEPSIYSKWERARWFIEQLSYDIEPYSQAQVSRIGRNLTLLQAKKAGVWVSNHTIGKGLGLNMGELPPMRDGEPAVTEVDKFIVEQEITRALQEDLQQGQPQQGERRGRPPTNRQSPAIKQKDGGTRSTVTTSR
jgi:hypothetical protein